MLAGDGGDREQLVGRGTGRIRGHSRVHGVEARHRRAHKTAALEYATQGVRVNAVCPGVIHTEIMTRFTHDNVEVAEQLTQSEPIGRFGTPEEIADAVVWLCWSAPAS